MRSNQARCPKEARCGDAPGGPLMIAGRWQVYVGQTSGSLFGLVDSATETNGFGRGPAGPPHLAGGELDQVL